MSSLIKNTKVRIKKNLHTLYKNIEIKEKRLNYLFLEITRICNLNCLHCGSDCKSVSSSNQLSTESWKKIIDYICVNFSNKVRIVITGGEPLMHQDLCEIGAYISSKKMKWGMVSNGILLDKDKMNNLENAGISSLTLSMDGLEESHNYLRNSRIAFLSILRSIEALGCSNLEFKDVVTCVYSKNLKELDQIAEVLIENKIKSWRLFRIFPSGRAARNKELQLSFDQTQEMISWIASNKKALALKGLNLNLSCEGWIPFETDMTVRDTPFFCRAGISVASILCDGTITGCSNNHESFYRGNIMKDDFKEMWINRFDDFRKRDWIHEKNCNNCDALKQCKGSSIHLWDLGNEQPNFCYYKDLC